MKRYVIDFRDIDSVEEAHEEIKDALGFPDHYGMNLDALNDCLSGLEEDCVVYIITGQFVIDEFDSIMEVFDNKNIAYEMIISNEEDEGNV